MMYCKKCTGKLYEEEIWTDFAEIKYQQIGCYQCSNKIQVEYREWLDLKKKISKAIRKNKNEKNKINR